MPKDPIHWCFKCEDSYTTDFAWERHLKSFRHNKRHLYECLDCLHPYSRKDDLYTHLDVIHSIPKAERPAHWGLIQYDNPPEGPQCTTTDRDGLPLPPGHVLFSCGEKIVNITDLAGNIITSNNPLVDNNIPSFEDNIDLSFNPEDYTSRICYNPENIDLVTLASDISGIFAADGIPEF